MKQASLGDRDTALRVLIVDQADHIAGWLGTPARDLELVLQRAVSAEDLVGALQLFEPDLVVADPALPGLPLRDLLASVEQARPGSPVVLVSESHAAPAADEALGAGARDYVTATDPRRLHTALRNALLDARERKARLQAERALQESQACFKVFMEHVPEAAYVKDLEGRYIYVNPAARKVIGRPEEAVIGHPMQELYPPELAASYLEHDQLAVKLRQPVEVTETIVASDGLRTFQSIKFPINGPEGQPVLVGGVSVDMTERELEQRRVAALARRHAVFKSLSRLGLHCGGRDELLQEACRIAVETAGARMAWIGWAEPRFAKVAPAVWHGHDAGYLAEVDAALDAEGERRDMTGWSIQFKDWDRGAAAQAVRENRVVVSNDIAGDPDVVFRTQALSRGYHALAALPLHVQGEAVGTLMVFDAEAGRYDAEEIELLEALASSVSLGLQRLVNERQLSFASWYDSLTELPNRALFADRLSQLLRHDLAAGRGVSLLVFDLRRFRELNASLPAPGGDEVLKIFAERLRATFGALGLVARLAGDRFAVALRDSRVSGLSTLGDPRWEGSLVAPMRVDRVEVHLGFKLGISVAPADGEDVETLFRHAEAALHEAKQSRAIYAFHSQDMKQRAERRAALEAGARQAVERRRFRLHYQPLVDLRSGALVGVEALIRRPDDSGRLLAADDIVPALEELGLVAEVGRWVVEQALADLRWWRTCGVEVPRVSVNVSIDQLRDDDFVGKMLAAAGGPAALADLAIEITEKDLDADPAPIAQRLRQLKDLGVQIVMDDFGSGRSSLSLLARLPVDVVKVDRSLVAAIGEEPSARAIVRAVAGLADALQLETLAEGVESHAAAETLQSLGIRQGQGYLYGKPQASDELLSRLMNGA